MLMSTGCATSSAPYAGRFNPSVGLYLALRTSLFITLSLTNMLCKMKQHVAQRAISSGLCN
jgi:hypothetical protein